MRHRSILTLVAVGVLVLGFSAAANASLSIVSAVGGGPATGPGISYVNFDSLPLGTAGGVALATGAGGSITVSLTPSAQVVTGSSSTFAAPFLSNSNGVLFGDPTVAGADTTRYITSGSNATPTPGAAASLAFSGSEMYLGILWGSVDSYNTLEFFNGAASVGSITGTDVTAFANGNQGASGTFYVNINSTSAFNRVVATSSQFAFEFDNVAFGTTPLNPVPEPSTLILASLGALVGGLALVRRRRAVS